jgi:hypothetical protein
MRLEVDSKRAIEDAAALRQISVSDYVRTVTVQQAEREVKAAREGASCVPRQKSNSHSGWPSASLSSSRRLKRNWVLLCEANCE